MPKPEIYRSSGEASGTPAPRAALLFQSQFQRALRSCVRRGFSVEECFALIWEETQEETPLPSDEESRVYRELLDWARSLAR